MEIGYISGLRRQVKLIDIQYNVFCICTYIFLHRRNLYMYSMHASVYLMSTWSESQMGVDAWKWTNTQTLISSCGECDATAGNNPKPEQNFKELWASQTTNGCVQPHHSHSHSHSHSYSYYPTSPPQTPSLFGSRSGRSCRTKGFKLLVETTSSASFEWMATNGWARRRTNRRKRVEEDAWGWGWGCECEDKLSGDRDANDWFCVLYSRCRELPLVAVHTHTQTGTHTRTHTEKTCVSCVRSVSLLMLMQERSAGNWKIYSIVGNSTKSLIGFIMCA